MSQPYPRGQALIAACSSGQGAIVVVEGETYQDDAYVYGQWFGAQAREVSFFPQNGWERVVSAVADLRAQLPTHRVIFGIVDRDFAPAAVMQQQAGTRPQDFIFRTPYFTVENYLLNPEGWLKVARSLTKGNPPAGWSNSTDVQSKIEDAYRCCIDLAAFNFTVRGEYDRMPGSGIEYKKHPKAVIRPENELLAWGQSRNPPTPLDEIYRQHQAMIQGLPQNDWPIWITGKAVLKVFLEGFAVRSVPPEMLKSLYLDKHPDPPGGIDALITRIVERQGDP